MVNTWIGYGLIITVVKAVQVSTLQLSVVLIEKADLTLSVFRK